MPEKKRKAFDLKKKKERENNKKGRKSQISVHVNITPPLSPK